MDLGIAGRTAIVCASSRGLGRACATALAREGARVVMNGRTPESIGPVARAIADETGADIVAIGGNLDDAGLRAELVAAAGGAVDILVTIMAAHPCAISGRWTRRRCWPDCRPT